MIMTHPEAPGAQGCGLTESDEAGGQWCAERPRAWWRNSQVETPGFVDAAEGSTLARHLFLTQAAVAGEIESWRPRNCESELQYRNSLYAKLEDAFRQAPAKEWGHGRARADIAFGNKIAIELKLDFNTTGKLQRLKGQMDDYRKSFSSTIIVLVGQTDRGLYEDLKKSARDMVVIQK